MAEKDIVYFYIVIQLVLDIRWIDGGLEWEKFAFRQMVRMAFSLAPLERFYNQVRTNDMQMPISTISVLKSDGIGGAILQDAIYFRLLHGSENNFIRLNPSMFCNALERVTPQIMRRARRWEFSEQFIEIPIGDLSAKSDPDLALILKITGRVGTTKELRFVQGRDNNKLDDVEDDNYFDPPIPSA